MQSISITFHRKILLDSLIIFSYLHREFYSAMLRQKPYFLLLAFVALWCIMIIVPPLFSAFEAKQTSILMYKFFSRICHQYDSRSLHLFGYQLGVCARCSMIYFGFFIGVIVAGLWQNRRRENFLPWFIVVLFPMLLDVALDAIGLHHTTLVTRVATGLIFGIGIGVLLTPIFVEGVNQLRRAKLS